MKTRLMFLMIFFVVFIFSNLIFAQPTNPTNLTVTEIAWMNHIAVKLDWQNSDEQMVRYNIYRKSGSKDDTGEFDTLVSNIKLNTYFDLKVFKDSSYSYYVTAVDYSGESEPSDTVEITLKGIESFPIVTGSLINETDDEPIVGGRVHFSSTNIFYGKTAITDALGEFKTRLLPGNYYVRSSAFGYIPEFYDDVSTIQQATAVHLNSGDSLNLEIALKPFVPPAIYYLSGNVTDNSGNPLRARIYIFPLRMNSYFAPRFVKRTITDSIGNYQIPVREGDTVIVFCKPLNRNLMPEYYDNKQTFMDADRIPVEGDVTGIDFKIEPAAVYNNGISGMVRNESDDGVMAHIMAFNISGNHFNRYRTVTDTLGNYSLSNLVPAEYILLAVPKEGYIPTFFRYDSQPTIKWFNADSVVVNSEGMVTDINFIVHSYNFEGFASVTGVVKDESGNDINGAIIFATDNNNTVCSYAISNSSGQFVLGGFEPGTYKIMSEKFGYNSNQIYNVTLDYNTNISKNVSFTLKSDNVTSTEEGRTIIKGYILNQNYPNPFNPTTIITYSLPRESFVQIKVFNVLGNEIETLVNKEEPEGTYEVTWNATNLPSGVYFYQLKVGDFVQTKKMMLLK